MDNVKVGSAAVKNGVATYTYTPTKAGNLTIKVFYSNSNLFKDSNSINAFYVDKATATATLSQQGSYYKATKLNVKLVSDDGTPLGGEKVSITIGGKTVTTNSNGIATYDVPLAPGTYSVFVKSASSNVVFNTVTKKVTIKKVTGVVISPTTLTTTYNSTKYFQVKVYKGSNLFVGVKLKLKIFTGNKYKTVTVTTNKNGIAKYAASRLALGKHKIIVSCAESTKYMTAKSKTSYVTIKKEAQDCQYTYEEIFLLGLQCIRDEDEYRLVKISELEEEVRDLREEFNCYDFLKKKLQYKEEELQEKRKEIKLSDKFDVIEYQRNQKLETVVEGVYSRYCKTDYDFDRFLRRNKVMIQQSCAINNLKTEKVVEKLKQKIQKEE